MTSWCFSVRRLVLLTISERRMSCKSSSILRIITWCKVPGVSNLGPRGIRLSVLGLYRCSSALFDVLLFRTYCAYGTASRNPQAPAPTHCSALPFPISCQPAIQPTSLHSVLSTQNSVLILSHILHPTIFFPIHLFQFAHNIE